MNKIFLLESKRLPPQLICGARRMQSGSLLLFQRDNEITLKEQTDSINKIPLVFQKIGDSFNACVMSWESSSAYLPTSRRVRTYILPII